MSEASIIQRIISATAVRAGTVLGIGDDAAVLAPGGSAVLSHDLLVQDVHFRLPTDASDLGWKALAVNLSDLAAMGAEPVAALVGLALPGPEAMDIEGFYAGMEELAAAHGVTIAGGDLSRGATLVIAVTAAGRLADDRPPLTRSGARAGDQLVVTGPLGASEAGRALLEADGPANYFPGELADALRQAHQRPTPEFAEARLLRALGAVALMDCSDGLVIDVRRMAEASDCAAVLELHAVPRAEGVDPVAEAIGMAPDLFAATAGEDYRLIAAVEPEAVAPILEALPEAAVFGHFAAGEGVTVLRDGAPIETGSGGYAHDV